MQKPFKDDFKPDYEKWEKRCRTESKCSFIGVYIFFFILCAVGMTAQSFFNMSYTISWDRYNFVEHFLKDWRAYITTLLVVLVFKPLWGKLEFEENKDKYREKAEQEAEAAYQAALARWEHEQQAKDEEHDRQIMREIRAKRMHGELSNEMILKLYANLNAMQNKQNQELITIYNKALQAIRQRDDDNFNNYLNELDRKLKFN